MPTKAEAARAAAERDNAKRHRAAPFAERTRPAQKKGIAESARGRSVHGRTKLQADAKAGKPETMRGIVETRGGELVTALPGPGVRPSRKSTRGSVPGGEKASGRTRAVKGAMNTPEARASRNK